MAKKRLRIIAAIPLLFGVQQFIEGLQWISPHPSSQSIVLAYAYLVFAFLVWPVYIPIAVYLIEKNKKVKERLKWFIPLGILVALTLFYVLMTIPIQVNILSLGIEYDTGYEILSWITFLYIFVVTFSPMISSEPLFKYLGGIIGVSALVALIFFQATFISVWCFFAATIAMLIFSYFFLAKRKRGYAK